MTPCVAPSWWWLRLLRPQGEQPSDKGRPRSAASNTPPPRPRPCRPVGSYPRPRPLPKAVGTVAESPLWGGKKRMRPELQISEDRHIAGRGATPGSPCRSLPRSPFCRVPALLCVPGSLWAPDPMGKYFRGALSSKVSFHVRSISSAGRRRPPTLPAPAGVTWPPCSPLEAFRATIVSNY